MRKMSLIAVMLVIAALLVSCGGKKNTQDEQSESAVPAAAEEPTAEPAAEEAETAYVPDVEHGKEVFVPLCGACHGPEGLGVENLGKNMTTSEFIAERTDEELLEFLKVGRAPDHPLNTTGVLMPPKGGNPALSDEDLLDIIAYVRTLQK